MRLRTMASLTSAAPLLRGTIAPNGLAILTLDRPKALNAMNLDMDIAYKKYLDEWASNPIVKSVLIESSSARAFSAGGDIKWMTTEGRQKHGMYEVALKVFAAEYSLICQIAQYKKPYISLMDGITMGFGIGLSGHGHYRIVTERTVLAMPENGIGLFPDVGFAYLAAKSPGKGAVGAYLALTGARISNPADALYAGIGTHYVPSQKLSSLKEALMQTNMSSGANEGVRKVLESFAEKLDVDASLEKLQPSITNCFGANDSILDCIDALKKEQLSPDASVKDWASASLSGLSKGAPYSLAVTKKHYKMVSTAILNPSNELSKIEDVMKAEYRIALRTSTREDFVEGVRAVLIEKDQNPKWQPSTLEELDEASVDLAFTSPNGEELSV